MSENLKKFTMLLAFGAFMSWRVTQAAAVCTDSPGDYCCYSGGPTLPVTDVPVMLNENLDTICTHGDCTSFQDVEWEIRAALAELYNTTGSWMRLYVVPADPAYDLNGDGWVDPAFVGATITGALHIYGETNCISAGEAYLGFAEVGGVWSGARVKMCSTINNGAAGTANVRWNPAHARNNKNSFRSILLHEIGHVLGQDHLRECGSLTHLSLMTSGSKYYSSNIMEPYTIFMRDNYGLRYDSPKMSYSSNGTTYFDLSSGIPASMNDALTTFAASNSVAGTVMWVAWRALAQTVRIARYTGSSWSVSTSDPGLSGGRYSVGIAAKSNTDAMFAAQTGFSHASLGETSVRTRRTTNSGTSWSGGQTDASGNHRVAAPGVTMTYNPEGDPKKSGPYIVMYRQAAFPGALPDNQQNEIAYRFLNESSPKRKPGMYASSTPSIACGVASVTGTSNCLLAYNSDDEWGGRVYWHQCRALSLGSSFPPTLSCGPANWHPYYALGTPVVTYTGNAAYPWNLSISQGGATIFSWRKSAGASAFQDQRSFSNHPQSQFPATGTRSAAGGRRYILTGN